ncbi:MULTISPECIES: hypothetical protein [unclassified Shinella]|jgi:hypothetical protein|uniref:hypothetical protein n=1 Tax=unclassified Shinella TaxID=2643062 RepID=UPI00234F0495|nr:MULTISPECIES: hypothetical protein [unclassified Shinella]MCO5151585.1 hypothetical protein [Shinella sp.]MDC7266408.1 hypothetical protein [Shinella sp. HY16]MDC7273305.1 hypothetical protein [Shinella sp. YZ44]
MCSLCGIIGGDQHWTDAAARPGVFTRNLERLDRHRERARRVAAANRVLAAFGMSLSDWQGASFILATRTGKSEMIDDLGHLWPAAERLAGRPCDPLDPSLITRMERSDG